VPGQRNTSPDVGVFAGLQHEVDVQEGTFDLHASAGRCVLVVEVVSPDERRKNDVVDKFREYHNAGVPLYAIIDQEKEDSPRQVRGWRHRPTGYEELPLDDQGRLLLGPLQLWLGLKNGRTVCYDARTGDELGDYCRIVRELEEADRRNQEQGLALEQAITETREQRLARETAERAREAAERLADEQRQARQAADQARQAADRARQAADQARLDAEKLAREQRQAREDAERQADEQRQARQAADQAREDAERHQRHEAEARAAAEKSLVEQKQAREAAEERIRQLEAALRALQPPA
jgi:hypothetical protein